MSGITPLMQSQPELGVMAFLFISFIPIILPICLLILSSFNKDLKGFIFLVGLVGSIMFLKIISIAVPFIRQDGLSSTITQPDLCQFYFLSTKTKLLINSTILGYTFMYFIMSMTYINKWNEGLLSLLSVILISDICIYLQWKKCASWVSYISSMIIGVIFAALYTMIIKSSNKELLYNYDIISNKEMCSRNFGNKKRFVCSKRKHIPKAVQAVS